MQKHKKMTALFVILFVVGVTFFTVSSNHSAPDAKTLSIQAGTTVTGDIENSPEAMPAVDVDATLTERGLGDENAPVRIDEYASLSCHHCASFHKETFDKLKEEYIDTGKVYFVFNDFPLSASALDGAMVARCLPEKNYFKFISFLFSTQEKWAFEANYKTILEQNAKLLGLGSDEFDACLGNQALRAGLVTLRAEASETHGINSTPSFVINGKTLISGNQSLERLKKIIDPLLPEEVTEEESGE